VPFVSRPLLRPACDLFLLCALSITGTVASLQEPHQCTCLVTTTHTWTTVSNGGWAGLVAETDNTVVTRVQFQQLSASRQAGRHTFNEDIRQVIRTRLAKHIVRQRPVCYGRPSRQVLQQQQQQPEASTIVGNVHIISYQGMEEMVCSGPGQTQDHRGHTSWQVANQLHGWIWPTWVCERELSRWTSPHDYQLAVTLLYEDLSSFQCQSNHVTSCGSALP